jgi:hypothetical protein
VSAFDSWPRSRRETPPTPAPDIAAEVDADMAGTMAWFAAGLALAAAACLPLAHITWVPTAAFTVSAVWAAGLGVHDRKKANR